MTNFEKVKHHLLDLGFEIIQEDTADSTLIIQNEGKGICNMMLDCEGYILIVEQHIIDLKNQTENIYKRLLQMNRSMIHGAFVLDESGDKVLFRDTLALENLDRNEIDSTFTALTIALVEHQDELKANSKN